MKSRRKTLKKSILAWTIPFILLVCIVMSSVQFFGTRKVLYTRYESYIENILRFVEGEIDKDDLAECIRTGVESEKYHELQKFLDKCRDRMNIHFLYVIEPLNTEPVNNIRNVIAGASKEEYETIPDQLVYLNMPTGNSYSPETAAKYLDAYRTGRLSFFEEISEWGDDYTGMLPLYDSKGNKIAALCVDVDIAEIHTILMNEVLTGIGLIMMIGICFIVVFMMWIVRKVTDPIEQLESCVSELALRCRDQRDPDALKINIPDIRTNNEVETLSLAFSEMSSAMQDYIKGMVTAEKAAQSAKKIADLKESMSSLFNNIPGLSFSKDAETGVYLACNQAFAEYAHKKDPDGVVGLTDAEIFDPVTASHFTEDDRIALSMDEPYIFFEDVSDAAGNPRQFETTKMKFIDDTGRLCTLGMSRDVTDIVRIRRENATTKEAYEKAKSTGIIYTHIAQTLAKGYTDLFYVNLETGEYIEYQTGDEKSTLSETRRGDDFFESCKREVDLYVHPNDRASFIRAMDRSTLIAALNKSNTFMMTYRLIDDNGPCYVNMKVSRMDDDENYIIVGVSDIDDQIRQRRLTERLQEEQIAYTRINALVGDFICIYVVVPETGRYREYSSTAGFESFALPKEGMDFFRSAREMGRKCVYPVDLDRYLSVFTMDNVLAEIKRSGVFSFTYRLVIDGKPTYTQLRAAMVEESDGPRIIVGINDVDAHVRQEEEYEKRLSQAQREVNIDALTGVKNKHAYLNAEDEMDRRISKHRAPEFAVVILDINDLKHVNDTYGHQAGDKYIKDACHIICQIFKRSPVFRVGGDEFAVMVQDKDYECIEELTGRLKDHNTMALQDGGIVIACGVAKFDNDVCVASVFERADQKMYENKNDLKSGRFGSEETGHPNTQ